MNDDSQSHVSHVTSRSSNSRRSIKISKQVIHSDMKSKHQEPKVLYNSSIDVPLQGIQYSSSNSKSISSDLDQKLKPTKNKKPGKRLSTIFEKNQAQAGQPQKDTDSFENKSPHSSVSNQQPKSFVSDKKKSDQSMKSKYSQKIPASELNFTSGVGLISQRDQRVSASVKDDTRSQSSPNPHLLDHRRPSIGLDQSVRFEDDDDSVINQWCEKNLNYGFKSHSKFLRSIEIQNQIRLQRLFFVTVLAIFCIEAFIRSLATQIQDNKLACFVNLGQQTIVLVVFAFLSYHAPKRSKNSYLAHYTVKFFLVILQLPFMPQTFAVLSMYSVNQVLLATAFVLIYSPIAEVSLFSVPFIVINQIIRIKLHKTQTPELQCIQDQFQAFNQTQANLTRFQQDLTVACQSQIIADFNSEVYLNWYDCVILGAIVLAVFLLVVFHSLRHNILEYKLRGILKNENLAKNEQFDDPNLGVYDCETVEQVQELKSFMNASEMGLAIAGYDMNSSRSSQWSGQKRAFKIQDDSPFKIVNTSLRTILGGPHINLQQISNFPIFKKCSLAKLQIDPNFINQTKNGLADSVSTYQNSEEVSYLDQLNKSDQINYSLIELITFLQKNGQNDAGSLYIKAEPFSFGQSEGKIESNSSQKDKNQLHEYSHCKKRQSTEETKVLSDLEQIHQKYFQRENQELSLTCGQMVFQLKVRPIFYKGKKCSFVSLHRMNTILRKCINLTQKGNIGVPRVITNLEMLDPLYTIIKYSQLLEQQMSEHSGFQTRTSIINFGNSSAKNQPSSNEISGIDKMVQKQDLGWSQSAFARYQFYLANMWSHGQNLMMKLMSNIYLGNIQNGQMILNFQKVSKFTMSIENHVKEFMLQFGPEIEDRNIHIDISQGSMPDHFIFTDWNLFDLILFNVVQNAIRYNQPDGAVSIGIFYRKEMQFNLTESKEQGTEIMETGKLVIVVKDIGKGIPDDLIKSLMFDNQSKTKDKENKPKGKKANGLYITKKLVQVLGGNLILKSKLNQGTQITFDIQTSSYPVRNFKPRYKLTDGQLSLELPSNRAGTQISTSKNEEFLDVQQKESGENQIPSQTYMSGRQSISQRRLSWSENYADLIEKSFNIQHGSQQNQEMRLYEPKQPSRDLRNNDIEAEYLTESLNQQKFLNEQPAEESKSANMSSKSLRYDIVDKSINSSSIGLQMEQGKGSGQDQVSKDSKPKYQSFADVIRSSISFENATKRSDLDVKPEQDNLKNSLTRGRSGRLSHVKVKQNISSNNIVQRRKTLEEAEEVQETAKSQSKGKTLSSSSLKKLSYPSVGAESNSKADSKPQTHKLPLIDSFMKNSQSADLDLKKSEEQKVTKKISFNQLQPLENLQNEQPAFKQLIQSNKIKEKDKSQNFKFDQVSQNKEIQQVSHEPPSVNQINQEFSFLNQQNNGRFAPQQNRGSNQSINQFQNGEISQSYQKNVYEQIACSQKSDNEPQNSIEKHIKNQKLNFEEIKEVEQSENNSEHFFSDLSIGESEHCYQYSDRSRNQLQQHLQYLKERPLQEFQQDISKKMSKKGSAVLNLNGFDISFNKVAKDGNQQSANKISLFLQNDYQMQLQKNSLAVSNSSSQIVESRRSNSSQHILVNFKSKYGDEKMKSQFGQIEELRNPKQSLAQKRKSLRKSLSRSSVSNRSVNEIRICRCRDILIIDSDKANVEFIQKFVTRLDNRGCDIAVSAEQGYKLLSLKLQANCCKNNYDTLFFSLEYEFGAEETYQKLKETIDMWNQKLKAKGKELIDYPFFVGMISNPELVKIDLADCEIIQKPVDSQTLEEIMNFCEKSFT